MRSASFQDYKEKLQDNLGLGVKFLAKLFKK